MPGVQVQSVFLAISFQGKVRSGICELSLFLLNMNALRINENYFITKNELLTSLQVVIDVPEFGNITFVSLF